MKEQKTPDRKDVFKAELDVAKIINKYGVKNLRKIAKKERPRINKTVEQLLKKHHIVGTNMEQWYRLRFQCYLIGAETTMLLLLPEVKKK